MVDISIGSSHCVFQGRPSCWHFAQGGRCIDRAARKYGVRLRSLNCHTIGLMKDRKDRMV